MIRRSAFIPFIACIGLMQSCFSTTKAEGTTGCTKDTDCAAGRICGENGRCMNQDADAGTLGGSGGRAASDGTGGSLAGMSESDETGGTAGKSVSEGSGGTNASGGTGGTRFVATGGSGATSGTAGRGGTGGTQASGTAGRANSGSGGATGTGGTHALSAGGTGGGEMSDDAGASGAAGASASCDETDPITCPTTDSMTLCLNGSDQTLTCDYACATLGFETGSCESGYGCECGATTDEVCADGVNAYCSCVQDTDEPCDPDDPYNDPTTFYVECHENDPANQDNTDFLKCLAAQSESDSSSMTQLDCQAAATACDQDTSDR